MLTGAARDARLRLPGRTLPTDESPDGLGRSGLSSFPAPPVPHGPGPFPCLERTERTTTTTTIAAILAGTVVSVALITAVLILGLRALDRAESAAVPAVLAALARLAGALLPGRRRTPAAGLEPAEGKDR
jgi:hypothetical protein